MKITPQTKLKNLKQIAEEARSPVLLLSADEVNLSRVNDYIDAYPEWTVQELADFKKFDGYLIEVDKKIIYDSTSSQ